MRNADTHSLGGSKRTTYRDEINAQISGYAMQVQHFDGEARFPQCSTFWKHSMAKDVDMFIMNMMFSALDLRGSYVSSATRQSRQSILDQPSGASSSSDRKPILDQPPIHVTARPETSNRLFDHHDDRTVDDMRDCVTSNRVSNHYDDGASDRKR